MATPVKRSEDPSARGAWHRGLTRDSVADAALRLLDRDGRAALTMRRLAQELGISAPSLYAHVSGKADLLEMVIERVLETVELPTASGTRAEDLIAGFSAYRRALIAHPGVALLIVDNPRPTAVSVRLAERSLTLLTSGGAPLPEALDRHVTAFAFLIGWVLQELMPPKGPQAPVDAPLVRQAISNMADRSIDERFIVGLRIILGL